MVGQAEGGRGAVNLDEYIGFDLETTGVDTAEDRIVQAYMNHVVNGEVVTEREWFIDPGVPIPQGASDVHGFTIEKLREKDAGQPQAIIRDMVGEMRPFLDRGVPLVGFNLSFDISMMQHEVKRWMAQTFWVEHYNVIDPLIIDKNKDRYRKGSRKLVDVAAHYGVEVDPGLAHDAGYDVYLAGKLAEKIVDNWRGTVAGLHKHQIGWAREQRESLQDYFSRTGKTNDDGSPIVIDTGWPIYNTARSA